MDIKAFIRELLFDHDCVIIPGFGGFIGNYSPARYDRASGLFYPPVKRISFNRNLSHNDGLLIGKISQAREVNYGDSRHMVDEFARELNTCLGRNEKVFFDHIGTFVTNRENSIEFEPEEGINYHLASFGLESFQYHPPRKYDVRKRITGHHDNGPVRQASLRKNLWRAAALVPILALLAVASLKTDLFRIRVETSNLNPLVTAEFENNRKAVDEAAVIVPDINPAGAQPSEIKVTEPEIKAEPAPVAEVSYCVVTGSFKSEENAQSHVRSLRKSGFDPEIVPASNGFLRVYAIRCRDLQTALNKRDSILKEFPGTWVSKQKPTL
ncbi:MAG: SPOR domain-containing protein [Bacteroidales bacterium]